MRKLLVPLLLLLLTAALPAAQFPAESRRIRWWLTVHGGEQSQEPRTYRLYEEVESLQLRLGIQNEFDVPLFVDQQTLRNSLRLTVTSASGTVDVQVEWPGEISVAGEAFRGRLSTGGFETVQIDGKHAAGWVLGLRQTNDERFAPGAYKIDLVMQPALPAFRNADGEPWNSGPWPLSVSETDLTVIVNRPVSIRERVRQALTEGRSAISEDGNWSAAASAYERALGIDPADDEARRALAGAYSVLRRYKEAIPLYEQLLPRIAGPRADEIRMRTGEDLAHAYARTGDEGNAIRVLQSTAFPSQLEAKMAAIRAIARQQ